MKFDIGKATFQNFISNKEAIEEEFLSIFFNAHPLLINKNLENYKNLDIAIIYLGFIISVSDFVGNEVSKNNYLKNNLKLSNINNINVTTIYLIIDAFTLMLNRSVFGISGISRMIFENIIIQLALKEADNVVNEKYFDWQVVDNIKNMKRLNKLPYYQSNTEFQKNFEIFKQEIEELKQKYQLKKLYNYGWANSYLNKDQDYKVTFNEIVDKVWAPANPDVLHFYYNKLSKYVHSTPSIIYNNEIDELLNESIPMSLYSQLIPIISMALDIVFCGFSYIINECNFTCNTDDLNKINEYYRNKLSK